MWHAGVKWGNIPMACVHCMHTSRRPFFGNNPAKMAAQLHCPNGGGGLVLKLCNQHNPGPTL